MEENYKKVKTGALVLKGEKKKKHKKHKKRSREAEDEGGESSKRMKKSALAEDFQKHGGWWVAENYSQISGPVALQFSNGAYMKAMDNGKFVLGAPHEPGQGPDPEEILMAMRVGEGKISLKSGYDKYIRLEKSNTLMGISEAVGAMEMFEPVFQDGKMALLGSNGKFMTADEEDWILCSKEKVADTEIIQMRSNKEREDLNKKVVPEELQGKMSEVELKVVKKYQNWQDHKIRLNPNAVTELRVAKREGKLHEGLLDRREKMKSDKFCK